MRDLLLYDRIPVRQRIFWVPLDGTLQLALDGHDIAIDARGESPAPHR